MEEVAPRPDPARPQPPPPIAIRIQPLPWMALVAYLEDGATTMTSIARTWREGETHRCTLCPSCKANYNQCLVMTLGRVPAESAALFSIRDGAGPQG